MTKWNRFTLYHEKKEQGKEKPGTCAVNEGKSFQGESDSYYKQCCQIEMRLLVNIAREHWLNEDKSQIAER